eukprot:GHVL01017544.1.p1 GENE.GHVL01017544.1~~GHVL01017544.1.p1  ORF type:complete len:436 (-),score=108.02 GHVL01017544.1:55-1323(-)
MKFFCCDSTQHDDSHDVFSKPLSQDSTKRTSSVSPLPTGPLVTKTPTPPQGSLKIKITRTSTPPQGLLKNKTTDLKYETASTAETDETETETVQNIQKKKTDNKNEKKSDVKIVKKNVTDKKDTNFTDMMKIVTKLLKEEKVREAKAILDTAWRKGEIDSKLIMKSSAWKICESRLRRCKEALKMFDSNEGWVVSSKDKKCTISWRVEEATPTHSVMVEGIVEAPLVDVAVVITEFDQFPHWFPYLKKITKLNSSGSFSCHGWGEQSLPWPLSKRDWVTERILDIDHDSGHAIVYFSSTLEENEDFKAPPVAHNCVRADVIKAATYLQPLGPNRTLVKSVANIDLKIQIIPVWILNKLARGLAFDGFNNLCRLSKGILELDKECVKHLKDSELPVLDWYRQTKNKRWLELYCQFQDLQDKSH